ncbi:MAG TPA: hypothetical protein VIJ79_05740 [Acidobacteriaceae bacterium]
MNHAIRRRLTFAFCFSLIFLAASITAAAQYYPPPPPPYPPPPYPPARYPQRPDSRPVYPRYRSDAPYFSPYAMFSAGHYSGLGVAKSTAPTESGGMTALGGTFGGYVLYPTPGPVHLGIDGRLIVENSANSTTFGNKILGGLVGFRVDGSGAPLPVVPYFQFEIGGVGTNNGTSTTRSASFAYQAQFGADFPFANRQIAARLEYGAGQLTSIDNTNHTLQTFSAGIVFHLR